MILVTGGAGFIGSHVIKKLLEENNEVICLDDFNDFYNPKFKENNIKEFLNNKKLELYRQDICDLSGLEKIFKNNKSESALGGIDLIVHLAARAGVRKSIENPSLYYQVNVLGTVNLLELCKKYNIKNFIFASSSSVYGNRHDANPSGIFGTSIRMNTNNTNNKKELIKPFSEKDKIDNPISPYAASKKAGELICHTYHYLYNINIACLRFFTVYGPCGRPDMAPYKFTELISKGKEIQVFGDGSTYRDYTYVDDIVSGILAAVDYIKGNKSVSASNGGSKYEIFNLGNSKPIELKYFIKVIEKAVGRKAKIKQFSKQPGDVEKTFANISKAKKLLGYNPKISIEEGMDRFVKWYKNSRAI